MDSSHNHVLSDDSHIGRRVLWATLVVVIAFNFFLFRDIGSLAVAIGLSLVWGYVLGTARKVSYPWMGGIGVAMLGILVAMVTSAQSVVQTISFLAFVLCGMLMVYLTRSGGAWLLSLADIAFVPFRLVVPYIQGAYTGLTFLARSVQHASRRSWMKSVFIGLVFGIPVASFLLSLFAGADPIFAQATRGLLKNNILSRVTTRTTFSTIIFLAFLPIGFLTVRRSLASPFSWVSRISFRTEMTVISALIAAVTGAFLWVQWPYIFVRVAAETDLSRFGVATYSEYVKRGFTELLFIACVLYALTWVGHMVMRKTTDKQGVLPYIQIILFGEIGLYIVSIFRRVGLYAQFHGLTLGRVYGGFFLLWMSYMFLTLLARHLWPKIRWVTWEAVGSIVLFFLFAFSNIEHLVATTYPPTVNHRVDYVYLSRLSSDGRVGWQKAYAYIQEVFAHQYDPKEIIGKAERQKIGYAGIIDAQLLRKYDRLVRVYGSPAEKSEYVKSVLEFEKTMIAVTLPEVSRRAQEERRTKYINGPYIDFEKEFIGEQSWVYAKLGQKPLVLSETLPYIEVNHIFPGYTADVVTRSFFTFLWKDHGMPQKNDMDKVFVWNWSDMQAFDSMKKDIPLSSLLQMQEVYFRFAKQIAAQPQSEQLYDADISFEGPFLESF